ncbi:DUF2505 domain-containing protein [Calidifontibacter terrae]
MKIDRDWTLPADADTVFAMLSDPEYQQLKTDATSTDGGSIEVTPTDSGADITIRRLLPTDAFPENIRAMVGSTITVVETQQWGARADDGSRSAALKVVVRGTPASMSGTITLAPVSADEARIAMAGDLKGGIPIIGRKIEEAAAPSFKQALSNEEAVSRKWIASH